TTITSFAVDADSVYVGSYGMGWNTGFVARVPKRGGNPVMLIDSLRGVPHDIVLDGGELFVAAGGVFRVKPTGGAVTPLVRGGSGVDARALAIDDATIYIGDEEFGLSALPRTGGLARRLPIGFVNGL